MSQGYLTSIAIHHGYTIPILSFQSFGNRFHGFSGMGRENR
jgi:hypothetical protein